MKTRRLTKQNFLFLLFNLFVFTAFAQQSTIEYDSDTNAATGPQLMILEKGDGGLDAPDDGWARIWFKNDADLGSRWAFLARPHTGATDNQNILDQPIIMAFNGIQKLGLSNDGYLRVNKSYTFPNEKGTLGQVLSIVDVSNGANAYADWVDLPTSTDCVQDADMDTGIKLFETDISDTIKFNVEGSNVAEMNTNRTSIYTKLDVYDNIIADGSLTTNGNLNAVGNLNAIGNVNLTGQLNSVGGDIEIASGDNLDILNGNANVNGSANINGNVNVNADINLTGAFNSVGGNIQIAAGDNLEILNGNANVNGNVNANADINLTGAFNSVGGNIQIAAGDNLELLNGTANINGAANINGDVTVGNGSDLVLNNGNINVTGNIGASGNVFCGGVALCSDERYKKDINDISNALDLIQQIKGVSYDWKTETYPEFNFTDNRQLGFIAQDLEKVLPEMVMTKEDGYKSVSYDMISPVLVEAIKEQQAMIDLLVEQNAALQNQISQVQAQIENLDINEQSSVRK